MQVVDTRWWHTKASILCSAVLRKYGIFRVSNIRSLDFIDDLLDVWWRWVAKCESFSIPIFILHPVLSYFPSFFISISPIHNSWCTELITMKNCFIQNHFNPKAQLIFTWKGNQFYQKHFVVVEQTGIR